VAVAALGLLASACGGGGGGGANGPNSGAAQKGGSVTYALPPGSPPNYIFPFEAVQNASVANASYFQNLLYRPLYWLGQGDQAKVDPDLSVAELPQTSADGKSVTIKLKNYVWSDGEPVTAKNVQFFLNMLKAEKKVFYGYVPGTIPDNLTSVRIDNDHQLTLTLNKAYSSRWFLYNQLTQITPMPTAWDKTSDTAKSDCTNTVEDCAAVYAYLAGKAKDIKSYASDPLWQVVDGPWKLTSFSADGNNTFVPNPTYTGPNKPVLTEFNEAGYTEEQAEYNTLRAGSQKVQVGYLPTTSAKPKPDNDKVGPNPLSQNYYLDPLYLYSINYFPLNLNNPKVGPIFQQPYVRQAIQLVNDQESVIKGPLKGYGVETTGPVPLLPDTYASAAEKKPLTFSVSQATQLLTSHGWKVPTDGSAATCQSPGAGPSQCGQGVAAGAKLNFNLKYASGVKWIDQEMAQLKSNASKAGIVLNLSEGSFNEVVGQAVPCKPTDATCTWEMGNWGGGWVFVPNGLPTGELLFQTGAGSNASNYSDPKADELIAKSTVDDSQQAMDAFQDYVAQQVPDIWQPNSVYELTEVAKNLAGVLPQNPYGNITPEKWYYVK
jgi:peptide/nickel transport system substrate-binding protein